MLKPTFHRYVPAKGRKTETRGFLILERQGTAMFRMNIASQTMTA
jgi:hypothetical protein